jgi:hypothetical protein
VTVIVAQVSLEELLEIPDLLVRAFLSSREPINAVSDVPEAIGDLPEAVGDVPDVVSEVREILRDVPHDARQADEPVGDPVGLCGKSFEICRKLCLLMQQKLHSPFNLLRGHRLKLHDPASSSVFARHYAIVRP